MHLFRSAHRVIAAISFGCLTVTAYAQTNQAAVKPAPAVLIVAGVKIFEPQNIDANIRRSDAAGWEHVRHVVVAVSSNEFAILAPHGFRITTTEEKVTMVDPEADFFMTFRLLAPQTSNANTVDGGKRHAMDQFPQTRVVEEYSKAAAGHEGPAFSLRGNLGGKLDRALRVALIPCRAGTLEFTVNANPQKAAEADAAFNAMLRSFRTNERGALNTVVRSSDRS